MTQPPTPSSGQRQIRLEVPPDLRAEYCNAVTLAQSAQDMTFDFVHIQASAGSARVQARIVMLPAQAKVLMRLLEQSIARHEARYGEIKVNTGPTLADELFGAVKPPSEDPS